MAWAGALHGSGIMKGMMPKDKIVSWAIQVEWSDGTIENLNDLPNGVADTVDEWLTENEKLLNLENV